MWERGWKKQAWSDLQQEWDIIVIGGGITGAGIFRRAVEDGYKTLLVEAGDFASGTSSRSSKLVHGGFRYLRNKQFNVTKESVREREWLLKEAKNLVTPMGFIMPSPPDRYIAKQFALGVVIYDLLAPKWKHSSLSREQILRLCPALERPELNRGFLYYDAVMDDARVVLRLIREGVAAGGYALNYAKVEGFLRTNKGKVCGVTLRDLSRFNLGSLEITARVVISAAGPWSDELRAELGAPSRLRKLRGSHLVFPASRLNLPHAVTLLHPDDHRAMFAIPWEGCTLVGTTDLDHKFRITTGEPFATPKEIEYLLRAADATFPSLHLEYEDILSTFAGLRPVINTGLADPSKESREHVVWEEEGLITVTGGKYTTFRIMAEAALQKAMEHLPRKANLTIRKRYFAKPPDLHAEHQVSGSTLAYLAGRYGDETTSLLDAAREGENLAIPNLPNLWSEIRWAARTGAVEHLDDLLLRRVRLGLLLKDGALPEMDSIRRIAQPELGWEDARWENEVTRYQQIYDNSYSPSPRGFQE